MDAEQTLALTITARDMASSAFAGAQQRLSLMAAAATAADAAMGRVGAAVDAVKRTLASFVPGAQRAIDVLAAFRRFQAQSWSGADPSYTRSFSLFAGILAPVVPLFRRFVDTTDAASRVPLDAWATRSSDAVGGRLSRATIALSGAWIAATGAITGGIALIRSGFSAIVEKSSELGAKVAALGVSTDAILAPALVGLGVIVAPLISQLATWAQQNQAVIATDVARWAVDTAGAAIDYLVPAISFVAQGWGGVQIAAVAVRGAVETTFGAMLSGASTALTSISRLAAAAGKKDLAQSLAESATFTRELGDEFSRNAATAPGQILAIEARIKSLQKLIAEAGDTAKKQLGPALAAAFDAVNKGLGGGPKGPGGGGGGGGGSKEPEGMMDSAVRMAQPFLSERRAEEAARRADLEAFNRDMQQAAEALARANEQEAQDAARRAAEQEQRDKQRLERLKQKRMEDERMIQAGVQSTLMGVVGAARTAIATGKNAAEVALNFLDGLANRILDNVVKGILGALTGGGGFSGVFGLLFGFATGGFVPESAGTPGKDSVPALLMPGELVIPRDQARQIRAAGAGLTAGSGGGGTAPIVINVDARSTVPDSRADLERRIRPVASAARAVERATGSR
jgi:hypothetical protein